MNVSRQHRSIDTAPPVVQSTAVRHGMGNSFQEYETKTTRPRLIGPICLAIPFTAFALAGLASTPLLPGLSAGQAGILIMVLAIAVLGDILVARHIRAQVRAAGSRMYLFEAGFVHVDGTGRPRAFPWHAITVRTSGSDYNTRPRDATYRVDGPDGATVHVAHKYWATDDVGELGSEVRRRVAKAQVPLALAHVESGRTLRFDRLTVDRHGLYHRGRGVVSWEQVDGVHNYGDVIVVETSRRFRGKVRYHVDAIPNSLVFSGVASALTRSARPR